MVRIFEFPNSYTGIGVTGVQWSVKVFIYTSVYKNRTCVQLTIRTIANYRLWFYVPSICSSVFPLLYFNFSCISYFRHVLFFFFVLNFTSNVIFNFLVSLSPIFISLSLFVLPFLPISFFPLYTFSLSFPLFFTSLSLPCVYSPLV